MTEAAWAELAGALSAEVETAWVLSARRVDTGHPLGAVTLLVRAVHEIAHTEYDRRDADRLDIRLAGWLPSFAAAEDDQSIPVFVHTHPNGEARHSRRDDVVDHELSRVATNRNTLSTYASLIVAGSVDLPAFAGRLWGGLSDQPLPIDRLRIIGEHVRVLVPAHANEAYNPEIFNRQILAFGDDGQRVLHRLRVGVVGAGGTGSSAIEQLLRLGVGHIVVIDKQTLDGSNVTRVYGSTTQDEGSPKASIAATSAARIGLGSVVVPVKGSVGELAIAEQLAQCDVVFGCTDDVVGRAILTRMPTHLLQLLIDCGVVLDSRDGTLQGIYGRVTTVMPLDPCLVCTGDVDPTQLRNDQLPSDELASLRREGYVPELATPDPAVVVYTTMTAAQAVNEMLGRLFGYVDDEPASNRRLLRIHDNAISNTHRPRVGKHMCGDVRRLAAGGAKPFLNWQWRAENNGG
jgi:molybdopterin/thiamine biosynthesis adenylyltransferase